MSASPLSLWSLIAPFDHHAHFLHDCLWPFFSDCAAMQAMMTNSATMMYLPYLTVHRAFKLHELPQSKSGARYRPSMTKVIEAEPVKLAAALSKLQHVTSLALIIRHRGRRTRKRWSVPLPPSLTHLHLTVSGRVWQDMRHLSLPSTLCELTVDDDLIDGTRGYPDECISGPLPARVHTLHIRSCHWFWLSSTAVDNTQLRSLTVARSNMTRDGTLNVVNVSLLPRSLTLLDMTDCDCEPLLPGALPDTLVSLSLPLNYRAAIVPGTLPATLERLQVGHACEEANELQHGCLPAGLRTFIVQQKRHDYLPVSCLPFTQPLSVLPTSLVELRLHNPYFNQPLDALTTLPHLTTLSIDSAAFKQPLSPITRLTPLHTLTLAVASHSPLPPLPSQLCHLTVHPASWTHFIDDRNTPAPRRQGYTHELTADVFAPCRWLVSVSIDAGVQNECGYFVCSTYTLHDWHRQQRLWPLFDAPIAPHVLPASLHSLRLPQHYPHDVDVPVVPACCKVYKGAPDMIDC